MWKYTKIDAEGIDPRSGHTAVLGRYFILKNFFFQENFLTNRIFFLIFIASDNRIIVYGGVRDDNSEALPQLVVLNTNDYKWTTPKIEEIESRVLHKANLVNDYMIISFGKFPLFFQLTV